MILNGLKNLLTKFNLSIITEDNFFSQLEFMNNIKKNFIPFCFVPL